MQTYFITLELGGFQKILELEFSKKFRFPKKKLSLAEGLENLKIRIYKEMLRTNRQNVLMGNPKSENRWREYHLMSVSENQFRCSIENRISAGKTLFPGNSIIFATFPPPSLLYACVFVETGIPLELSNRPTLSSDRIDSHRHRLFELKRAAPFQTSQNVSICAAAIAERGKKKVSRCSKINRDTSVKRIRGIPVVRK